MNKYIEVRRCHENASKRTLIGRTEVLSVKKNAAELQRIEVASAIPADSYAVLVSYREGQDEFINY